MKALANLPSPVKSVLKVVLFPSFFFGQPWALAYTNSVRSSRTPETG